VAVGHLAGSPLGVRRRRPSGQQSAEAPSSLATVPVRSRRGHC